MIRASVSSSQGVFANCSVWACGMTGLVETPEEWAWSSDRSGGTGEKGVVEVDSEWTAREVGREHGEDGPGILPTHIS